MMVQVVAVKKILVREGAHSGEDTGCALMQFQSPDGPTKVKHNIPWGNADSAEGARESPKGIGLLGGCIKERF